MNTLPFVRCVGIGTHVCQRAYKKAYDYRLICILCGDGYIEIDGAVYSTTVNQVYIVSPGTVFRVRSTENQKIAVINFDCTYDHSHLTDPILSVDAETFNSDKILKTDPIPFIRKTIYDILSSDADLFEEMYRIYLRDDMETEFKNFMLSSRLAYVISKILYSGEKMDDVAYEVYRYILDNVCRKLTVECVAKSFNYSPSYIEKLLRKNYNTSFKQLILETRLKKAIWLLENTSLSCSEISSQLGFYSSQHFTQTFKKKYHKKPTDFR